MKYLKYFEQASAYEAYKNGSDFILPNVSYAADNNVVYYNPYVEKEIRLICTYNVTDTANSARLCNSASNFTSMEVDGVLQDNITTGYTFDTVGEHIIKFELVDPTSIGSDAFGGCSNLTSVTIPNSVTSISGVAFGGCSNLNEITCLATTAPIIQNDSFGGVKENGILKVPKGSDYSTWMSTEDWYLGYNNWTIEYI